jgi:coenzyme F420-reducing hydrogenase alpha subunit
MPGIAGAVPVVVVAVVVEDVDFGWGRHFLYHSSHPSRLLRVLWARQNVAAAAAVAAGATDDLVVDGAAMAADAEVGGAAAGVGAVESEDAFAYHSLETDSTLDL